MISGFFHFNDDSEDVLLQEEFNGVSYLSGNEAGEFLLTMKEGLSSRVLDAEVFLNDVNLLENRPAVLSLDNDHWDDFSKIDESLKGSSPFLLLDLSSLNQANAYEAVKKIGTTFPGKRILVYVPQIKETLDGIAIDRFRPLPPTPQKEGDLGELAFEAFVADIVEHKTPKEGDLVHTPKRKFIIEPIGRVEEDVEDAAEEIHEEEVSVSEPIAEEPKPIQKANPKSYEPVFFAIFFALTITLNIISHTMKEEESIENYRLICSLLGIAFLFCEIAPMYFAIHDEKDASSPYTKICCAEILGLAAISASIGFSLASLADYGPIAYVLPFAYLIVPILDIGIAYLLEYRKIIFKGKKRNNN